MAIAISSSRTDSTSVPGVAFKCLNQGQCSHWLEADSALIGWRHLNV